MGCSISKAQVRSNCSIAHEEAPKEEFIEEDKPFDIAIIGGCRGTEVHEDEDADEDKEDEDKEVHGEIYYFPVKDNEDPEECLAIKHDSMLHIKSSIPTFSEELRGLQGAMLPNGDLLVNGGYRIGDMDTMSSENDEYLQFKVGSNQWIKVGTMQIPRFYHASVLIDGCLFTTGGIRDGWSEILSNHEAFSIEGGVMERKRMPIALGGHTATIFGNQKIIVCGGIIDTDTDAVERSQRTFIYDVKADCWTEGPPLLVARSSHCSSAIFSNDGSIRSVIVIGGRTDQEKYSNTTEIFDLEGPKWAQGPKLPLGIEEAACIALPPTHDLSCVVVGGWTEEEYHSSNVYGLSKSLTEWTLLGKIKTGRSAHIILPIP